MDILLPPDLQQFVSDQVRQGNFPTASEAVCHAVATLRDREMRKAELGRDLEAGLEDVRQGNVQPLDIEAFKAEARRRLAATQTQ